MNSFLYSTYHDIQRPGIVIARKIGQLRHVGYTNDRHKCRSGRKQILSITPPITSVHLTVFSATFCVSEAHSLKIQVLLNWVMRKKAPNTFENIPVVLCSEDMGMIFNPTSIAETEIKFWNDIPPGTCSMECINFEVGQSAAQMLIYPQFRVLTQ